MSIQHDFDPKPTQRSQGFKMGQPYYRTWGPKARRMVDSFGQSQWVLLHRLESDPNVKSYCEMFPSIDEYIKGKRFKHLFTMWVQYQTGQEEIIDVLSRKKLIPDLVGELRPRKWSQTQAWCRQNNYNYRYLLTNSKELQLNTFIKNWTQILPFIKRAMLREDKRLVERVGALVQSRKIIRLAEIATFLSNEDPDELFESVFLLHHMGKVHIDLSKHPVSTKLEVWPCQ